MQPLIIKEVKRLIQPVIDQEQVELVDLIYRRQSSRNILRLLVDRPNGVNLDDLSRINKNIGQLLDASVVIEQGFVLEVNSPGLDRPLVTKRDFQRNLGKLVKLILKNNKGTIDIVVGDIKNVGEDRVLIDTNGTILEFLFENIIKAKLEIHC